MILTVDKSRLERNSHGLVIDSGVFVTVRDTVAAKNAAANFWLRNTGTSGPLFATIENSVAAKSQHGFLVQDGARVTVRNSAAVGHQFRGFWAYVR